MGELFAVDGFRFTWVGMVVGVGDGRRGLSGKGK